MRSRDQQATNARILELYHKHQPITRYGIAERTGVTPSHVGFVIRTSVEKGKKEERDGA